ncbi:MAG: hypothetical protein LBQ42_14105 [Synergistaceae bacterium]|nr:hypothetical protein [Synergistaceae bacterium]
MTSILDFWRWGYSDLLVNSARGVLAEYIVALALGVDKGTPREEWATYDLLCEGIKIEVKSSAYLQSWGQKDFTKPLFSIAPTKPWDAEKGTYGDKASRGADVYVFCLLKHKDPETIDPTNLDQWEFYVLPTETLDAQKGAQAHIGLSNVLKLNPQVVSFPGLRDAIFGAAEPRTAQDFAPEEK